jgi:hypothetical protein
MILLSFSNFIVIQYELLIKQFNLFDNILIFALVFTGLYIPIVTIIGRFDFKHKKGGLKVEQTLIMHESPLYQRVFANQEKILEDLEELKKRKEK